jgi:hypothetical protein
MTNQDDQTPKRLSDAGSELERWLLHSAELEREHDPALEQATLERALAEKPERRTKMLRRLLVPGLAAAAMAAGTALIVTRAPIPPAPSAEAPSPRSSAAPVATPPRRAVGDPCAHPVKATGTSPLIDDLEDRNGRVLPLEGRDGAWGIFNDGTGAQEPAPFEAWHPTLIPGRRGASRYAMHTRGGAMSKWGATNNVALLESGCYDASVYAGVTFYAKGPSRVLLTVQMSDVVPAEFGGTCEKDCYDSHGKAFELGKRWQRYSVLWHELAQQGFGPPVDFDPRRLRTVMFGVTAADTPFDFWIDDVAFVTR